MSNTYSTLGTFAIFVNHAVWMQYHYQIDVELLFKKKNNFYHIKDTHFLYNVITLIITYDIYD